ncbi:unnamed protein product, partial [Brachionus calyciflorus]
MASNKFDRQSGMAIDLKLSISETDFLESFNIGLIIK